MNLIKNFTMHRILNGKCIFKTFFKNTTNKKFKSTNPIFSSVQAPFIQHPRITNPSDIEPIPIYRVMNQQGQILDATQEPILSKKFLQKMYRDMIGHSILDKVLIDSQRQGRISFYTTSMGEEATSVGSGAGLNDDDLIYPQYRESGLLIWRQLPFSQFIDQCYGNCDDEGKGRQMPVHYGSKKLNFVTTSSPVGTQIPQAVGAAYALKLQSDNKRCVLVYFGEGTASEGDAHAAFNFAATLNCPIILFCRNNGFAVSTSTAEQYRGDGIAGRASGYGIATIRVDGTDILAMYNATKIAREYVITNSKPIVFEAMSYRIGHHTTSDDSSLYRSMEEVEMWNTFEHPIVKFKNYLKCKEWWDENEENDFEKKLQNQIRSQTVLSEKKPKPEWREMFTDVYHEMPLHLKQQLTQMEEHVKQHETCYPLKDFKNCRKKSN